MYTGNRLIVEEMVDRDLEGPGHRVISYLYEKQVEN